jgi:LemA protein
LPLDKLSGGFFLGKTMIGFIIFLAIVLAIVFWAVGIYNRLVSFRNRFKNSFAQIDVQLKRRYDLIPNLVETAKGYMKHERETLEAVIAARNQAVSANAKVGGNATDAAAVQQMAASEGALSASLGKLFALSEAYPDLKANQNMMQLTEELTGTENKIGFSRQAYNDSVMEYNTAIEQFPGSIFANMFAFKPAELLQATEAPEERKAVKVTF